MRSESKLCLALEMQHWHFAVFNFLGWYLNVGRLSLRHIILKFIRTATRPGRTTPTLFGDDGIWNCCANSVYFKGSLSFPARPQDACLPSCPWVWDQLTRKPGCFKLHMGNRRIQKRFWMRIPLKRTEWAALSVPMRRTNQHIQTMRAHRSFPTDS